MASYADYLALNNYGAPTAPTMPNMLAPGAWATGNPNAAGMDFSSQYMPQMTPNSLESIGTLPPTMWDNFKGSLGGFGQTLKDSGMLSSLDTNTGIKTDGWGGMALGAAQGAAGLYMGMKQYGLAKNQLAFQKNAFNTNFAAQKQATNTALEDRQRARVASNGGAYQSVGDYMKQNGVA